MIIDCILDAKGYLEDGIEPDWKGMREYMRGEAEIFKFNGILKALDTGENKLLQDALCKYIDRNGYNPEIKDVVRKTDYYCDRNAVLVICDSKVDPELGALAKKGLARKLGMFPCEDCYLLGPGDGFSFWSIKAGALFARPELFDDVKEKKFYITREDFMNKDSKGMSLEKAASVLGYGDVLGAARERRQNSRDGGRGCR